MNLRNWWTMQEIGTRRYGRWLRWAAFIVLVVGVGLLIGALNIPGAWYAGLNKPPFNPPNWIFAPVWTVLYFLIAVVGCRVFDRNARGTAAGLWTLQMVLNYIWSPVFFSLHRIDLALVVIFGLLVSILAFAWRQWSEDRASALLFIPYAAWVGFALALNAAIFLLN